ncbi:MAG: cell division protein FtsL [Caulobacteraceae bacterium]
MSAGVFSRRLRGFRIVDLFALVVFLALAFTVYAFKTLAGAQGAATARVERQIVLEQKRLRLLHAEIAHLENPGRIERLSTAYLGLGPVQPGQEITPAALAAIAQGGGKPPVGKPASGEP